MSARLAVVEALFRSSGGLTINEIAEATGLNPTTAKRKVLELLEDGSLKGVEREEERAGRTVRHRYRLKLPPRLFDITVAELLEFEVIRPGEAVLLALELEGGA